MTSRSIRLGAFVALFALVLGGRWAVVDRFGMDLPEWDEWDAEGLHCLLPWMQHRFTLDELCQAHNEHRVVVTELVSLALTLANGQWDQRLECTVNAAFAALLAVAFFAMGCQFLGRWWLALLFAISAVAFGLPLAWQNVLGGFHSQQLFLIGFSCGAVVWLPESVPWSRRWWLGAGCSVLALGTMGSGFFAAPAVAGLVALRLWRRESSVRFAAPALILCAAEIAVGWFSRAVIPSSASLHARSAQDFALTVIHSLEWPDLTHPWLSVVFWLPWACLTTGIFRGTEGAGRMGARALAGLGGWVLLQIMATGYARGAGGGFPASRYIDTLAAGAVVNALCLGLLWGQRAPGSRRRLVSLLALVWACGFAFGIYAQLRSILTIELPPVRTYYRECVVTTLGYIATGDAARLRDGAIPYPNIDRFFDRVSLPELQSLMPVSVRAPLALDPQIGTGAFVRFDGRLRTRGPSPDEAASEGPRGVSPFTPLLVDRVTWGSFDARSGMDWSSAELTANRGWLNFHVAGHLGEQGVTLELRDAVSGEVLAAVTPDKVPGDTWRSTYVPAPDVPFVVVAHTPNAGQWFAFSEPVEAGTFSFWAAWAVRRGMLVAEFGGVAAVLIGLLGLAVPMRNSGASVGAAFVPPRKAYRGRQQS